MPGLPAPLFDRLSRLPLYLLGPIVAVCYERSSVYLVVSLRLEVKISTPSCVMYSTSPPPRTLLLRIYFSLPTPHVVTLSVHTHTSHLDGPSPSPYRLGTNSSLSTQMYIRVYILLFRFLWSAPCCTYSMCLSPSRGVDVILRLSRWKY